MARTLVLTFDTNGSGLCEGDVVPGTAHYEVWSRGRNTPSSPFPIRGVIIRTGTWQAYDEDLDGPADRPYVYLRCLGGEHAIPINTAGLAIKKIEP